MKFCLLVFVLVFAGCATPPKKIVGPDGSEHQLLTCDEVEVCYEEATKLCGKYQIVNTNSATYTDAGDKVRTEQKLLIKCAAAK